MKLLYATVALILLGWGALYYQANFASHEYAEISDAQRQAALEYLDGKLTPLPDAWRWQNFTPQPNVELRAGSLLHPASKGTVVIIPGFTATIEMIAREIVFFHKAGYSVAAIEYRGQGKSYRPLSNPEKGYVEDYSVLAKEVGDFARQSQELGKPLFFYSISKGAHITLRMAAEQDIKVDAFALMVPMVKINTGTLAYDSIRLLAEISTSLGLSNMYAPGQKGFTPSEYGVADYCNSNPETAQTQSAMFALNEELRTRGTTIKWLHQTIQSTDTLLEPDYTRGITAPIRMFTAGVDHLVDSDAAKQLCSHLENCTLTHVESAYHCITRENFALYDALLNDVIVHFDAVGESLSTP